MENLNRRQNPDFHPPTPAHPLHHSRAILAPNVETELILVPHLPPRPSASVVHATLYSSLNWSDHAVLDVLARLQLLQPHVFARCILVSLFHLHGSMRHWKIRAASQRSQQPHKQHAVHPHGHVQRHCLSFVFAPVQRSFLDKEIFLRVPSRYFHAVAVAKVRRRFHRQGLVNSARHSSTSCRYIAEVIPTSTAGLY